MNLELLETWEPAADPFLERFITARGCGPHHITFVVHDLDTVLPMLAAHDVVPVKRRLEGPLWREVFLHPRDAQGTVVQIADTTNAMSLAFCFERACRAASLGPASVHELGWGPGDDGWWEWPGRRGSARVVFERVVIATPDIERSRELYADLLGGEVVEQSVETLELVWPGGGCGSSSASIGRQACSGSIARACPDPRSRSRERYYETHR